MYRVDGALSEETSDEAECPLTESGRKRENVKLGIWTEMSGLKSCEALASTCRLHCSLDGCLKFRRSRQSRRVWS